MSRKKKIKLIDEEDEEDMDTSEDNDNDTDNGIQTISVNDITEYDDEDDDSGDDDEDDDIIDKELMEKLAREHFNRVDDEEEYKPTHRPRKRGRDIDDEDDSDDEDEEVEVPDSNDMLQQLLGQMFGGGMGGNEPNYSQISAELTRTQEEMNRLAQEMKDKLKDIKRRERELEAEEREIEKQIAISHYKGVLISVVALIIVAFVNAVLIEYLSTVYAIFMMFIVFGVWFLIVLHVSDDTPHTIEILQDYRKQISNLHRFDDDE